MLFVQKKVKKSVFVNFSGISVEFAGSGEPVLFVSVLKLLLRYATNGFFDFSGLATGSFS
ncbi:hypothetical protein AGMMS49949_05010 [Alphaproteobacteria bacterium]|nr:hypothetical protein AGMMS49949_05010 [Alphaproteobacteria bacterium]GHS97393.1 hypothetical protein AGMMS50296_4330 [Alphaproteobacteria bacterium]